MLPTNRCFSFLVLFKHIIIIFKKMCGKDSDYLLTLQENYKQNVEIP